MENEYKKQKNELTLKIGKNISQKRKERKFSQQDMEDLSVSDGVSSIKYRTLSLIEQGYGDPRIGTLNNIASVLDIPLYKLLMCDEHTTKITKNDNESDLLFKATSIIKQVDEKNLKIIIKQLEAFL